MTTSEPRPDAARPEIGSTVRANGILTNYLDAGTGDPWSSSTAQDQGSPVTPNWRLTIPALADAVRVLAPDTVGFG